MPIFGIPKYDRSDYSKEGDAVFLPFPADRRNVDLGTAHELSRSFRVCRWNGLRLLAGDKTTLALPESPSLWKHFGAHRGQQGLGAIAVEFCCLFDLISRAPLRLVYGKVCTSEHKLIGQLIQGLKKSDLPLLDAGFYYGTTFSRILQRKAHFIIPTTKKKRPQVLQMLGPGDYLCRVRNYQDKTVLTVRVVFVY